MTSRQHSQMKNTRKHSSTISSASNGGMFESRPFVVQASREENSQQPDLKTSMMRAERYGHRIKNAVNTEQVQGEGKNETNQPAIQCSFRASRILPGNLRFSKKKFPFLKTGTTHPVAPTGTTHPVVQRQRPDLTPEIFKRDFMKESTDLADDTIAGRRHGRGGVKTLGFHVTPGKNLPSILSTGLDSNKGGTGGASELRPGSNFVKESTGFNHYSNNTYISGFYGKEIINGKKDKPNLLGIRTPEQIGRDPLESRGAYRTNQNILPTDVTNLGEGATNKAIANYEAQEQKIDQRKKKIEPLLNENRKALTAANRIPNTRIAEKGEARKQANEERRLLHEKLKKANEPLPFPDESVLEDISKNSLSKKSQSKRNSSHL